MAKKLTNAEIAMQAHKKQQKIKKQAASNTFKSMKGERKEVVLSKGTDGENTIIIVYPGIDVASQIVESNAVPNSAFGFSLNGTMHAAIDNGIIVSPHITSFDYWDTHDGFVEAATAIYNFLATGMFPHSERD